MRYRIKVNNYGPAAGFSGQRGDKNAVNAGIESRAQTPGKNFPVVQFR
jgi:hypothetical protein